jgi:rhodanese-related sulfurtransferase
MEVVTIGPRELAAKRQGGEAVELIDVRTPVEYREVHCDFARNVPLSDLDPRAVMSARDGTPDKPLFVICRSGSRGKQACEKFLAAGYANVVNVEGGTLAWAECGLPVSRGKKAISLERQVRIAAGSMVLLGAVLGYFVHPYFLGLSAFVGAGLVFAGVTDTCGMGMMLARMPWNQARAKSAPAPQPEATCSLR